MNRRILSTIVATGTLTLAVGCGGSSSAPATPKDVAKNLKEAGKDLKEAGKGAIDIAKEKGKEALDAGKEGLAKLAEVTTKELPAIETKINGLSGDAKTKASEALAALKKALEDAKATVADPEKWKTAWEGISAKLADLKKQIGL